MTTFHHQTVFVTGGTGGQGASHVRAFHAAGANVMIGDIDAERGAALAADLGDRARFVNLDVTDEASWADAIAASEEAFGAVTVLVNNAGVQNPPALIEGTDRRTWARILDINLTGTFLGIKAVAPALRRAGGGAIVNIASTSGIGGTAHYAPYVTSKWAVRGLTKTAALELGRDNIRVNAIHPGVIATPFITEPAAGSDARSPTSTPRTRSRSRGWASRPMSRGCCSSSPRPTRRSSPVRSTSSTADSSSGRR